MAQKRPKGAKNYFYLGVRGTEIVAVGALALGKFYKITGIATSGSGLPATAKVGDVVYCSGVALTLVSGDKVIPFTLEKLAFVTNIPHNASKEKFEDTVQIDDAKNYAQGDKSDLSGTMEGYFLISTTAGELTSDKSVEFSVNALNRFFKIVKDAGTGKTGIVYTDAQTGMFDFFLGRNETAVVGEVEVFEYLPSLVDSLQLDKPMQGNQTFTMQYTVLGAERPNTYFRTVA